MSNSTLMPTSAAEAVANGAQLLDEQFPGWWRNINLEVLSIQSCGNCVCGQLAFHAYGQLDTDERYMKLLNRLLGTRLVVPWTRKKHRKDVTHGFGYSTRWTFEQLDEEWGKVIRARLEADKLSKVPASSREAALV